MRPHAVPERAPGWWAPALTLRERAGILRESGCPGPLAGPGSWTAGNEREFWWRQQAPFGDGDLLARRLAADRLTGDEFTRAVSTPAAALAGRLLATPAWAAMAEATALAPAGPPLERLLTARPRELGAFLRLAEPVVGRGPGGAEGPGCRSGGPGRRALRTTHGRSGLRRPAAARSREAPRPHPDP
jgi:hypothetical protein